MRVKARGLLAALALAALGGAAWLLARPDPPREGPRFLGSASCRECHAKEFEAWTGSDHAKAMAEATDATVLGDFGDATFERFGVVTRFRKREGRFFLETEGAEHEVLYTFGVDPLQQYLVAAPRGRLQAFSVAWDTKEKRWFHLYEEEIAPKDPLHWTKRSQNWNFMCAECHSTGLRRDYDAATDTFRTTWEEISVGCEECHGPGSAHVDWARERADGEYAPSDPKGLRAAGEPDTCARCHSRRSLVAKEHEPGRPFLDEYAPSLLAEPLYHADGQIREEVYEWGSFLQSKMGAKGVTCGHCHEPHGARLRLEGNFTCVRCHKPEPPADFPSLRSKDYDSAEHHHHEPGTPGSRCVDCHMAARTYMVVDPRRDHSFRVPRPDLTKRLGVPNACNGCHADRSADWALEALARWYPGSTPPPHFAEAFDLARRGRPGAAAALAAVARDPAWTAFVRASALDLLGGAPVARPALLEALRDPDPLVRAAALRGLGRAAEAVPLLGDPVRSVRVEAVIPAAGLAAGPAFERALGEYRERQEAYADRPERPFNLAVLAAAQGDASESEKRYREAIGADPLFAPARFNLALLLNAQGRNDEAEREYRAILASDPENGEAWYSLGLLLAEMGRFEEAVPALQGAARRLPGRGRIRYNLGLALLRCGRGAEAERELLEADRLSPADPEVWGALLHLHEAAGNAKKALEWAELIAARFPRTPGIDSKVDQLRAAAAR
jgi:tetratricopeptide (TPR) repeat protein